MTDSTFTKFLIALRDECKARLFGSFANGTEEVASDIDLCVPDRNMKKAIDIFERFEVSGESCIVGSWSSPRNMDALPRPVEIISSCWAKTDRSFPESVTIYNVKLLTYRYKLKC